MLHPKPQKGEKDISIRDIVSGPNSSAVILSNGTMYVSGNNQYGQLGQGHKNDVLLPTLFTPPDESSLVRDQISKVSIGDKFSAIIDTNGDLYTMGYNGRVVEDGVGCLGHGYFAEEYLLNPTLVDSLVEDGCTARDVVVGSSHMAVLTTDGEVLTVGSGRFGRCGNLDSDDQLFLEPVDLLMGETDICQIAAGNSFTLALTEGEGIVYAWGRNQKGQCGTGSGLNEMYAMEAMPVPVEGMLEGRKVVKIAAGHSHACALTDRGELFFWGMKEAFLPELMASLGHTRIVDVSCGQDYTIALDEDGRIFSFGKGKTGVLGLASQTTSTQPCLVEGMLGKKVTKVSAGWSHVACLAEEEYDPEILA